MKRVLTALMLVAVLGIAAGEKPPTNPASYLYTGVVYKWTEPIACGITGDVAKIMFKDRDNWNYCPTNLQILLRYKPTAAVESNGWWVIDAETTGERE